MSRTNVGLVARLVSYYADLAPALHEVAAAWDTPGLVAGIPIYTPVVDEVFWGAWAWNPVNWNGTAPNLRLYPQGADPVNAAFRSFPLGTSADTVNAGWRKSFSSGSPTNGVFRADGATPMCLRLTGATAVNPGSTIGTAKIQFLTYIPIGA